MSSNGLPIDGESHSNGGRDGAFDAEQQQWQSIRDALRGLRFGTVTIIVQDGVIIQIDRTEKRRLRRGPHDSQAGR